jgi:hypothetical protein
MDLASALQRLANYRTKNSRASREIFQSGVVVFRNDALRKLGDDSWQFLESLALAAVDVGRIDVAEVSQLPRVLVSGCSLSLNGHRLV